MQFTRLVLMSNRFGLFAIGKPDFSATAVVAPLGSQPRLSSVLGGICCLIHALSVAVGSGRQSSTQTILHFTTRGQVGGTVEASALTF